MGDDLMSGGKGPGDFLRGRSRAVEVERRLYSLRLKMSLFKWVFLPAFLVFLVVALRIAPLESTSLRELFPGLLAVGGAAGGLAVVLRGLRDEILELEKEQESPEVDHVTGR